MKYNPPENTDIRVSQICLGTMTWGQQNSREDGFAQMDEVLNDLVKAGKVRHIGVSNETPLGGDALLTRE